MAKENKLKIESLRKIPSHRQLKETRMSMQIP